VVAWDVEVTNQNQEPVAVYTILTLVKRQAKANDPDANDSQTAVTDSPQAPAVRPPDPSDKAVLPV